MTVAEVNGDLQRTGRDQMKRGIWILSILVSVSGLSIRESEAEGPYKLKMPLGLQEEAAYIPPDNPLTIEKINLGKQLYFDKRLSADGTVACATCHTPDKGFSDGRPTRSEEHTSELQSPLNL